MIAEKQLVRILPIRPVASVWWHKIGILDRWIEADMFIVLVGDRELMLRESEFEVV